MSVRRRDTAGDMPPGFCIRPDSGISWESVSWSQIPRSISTGTVLPGMALSSRRHSPQSGQPAPSWYLFVWQEACCSSWRTKKEHGHLHLDGETRRLLLQMSPATIGRLLAGERKKYRLHGISHTRSTPLEGRIPIQTCMDPPMEIPGALAVDLVGHDGGQAVDDFGWILTVTDCTTGWTEAGAVRTNAEVYVVAALETCLRRYPGRVVSLHSDNGSEFINGHLVRFCHAQGTTSVSYTHLTLPTIYS